jgi:hypothetical protein
MSRKFLLIACAVNTLLFILAGLNSLSVWLVLLAEVAAHIAWVMWRSWFDPAQQLSNQGAHMNWVHAGMVRDDNGWRDNLLQRDGLTARISYAEKRIYIVEPTPSGPYQDFLEIERLFARGSAVVGSPPADSRVGKVRAESLDIE